MTRAFFKELPRVFKGQRRERASNLLPHSEFIILARCTTQSQPTSGWRLPRKILPLEKMLQLAY